MSDSNGSSEWYKRHEREMDRIYKALEHDPTAHSYDSDGDLIPQRPEEVSSPSSAVLDAVIRAAGLTLRELSSDDVAGNMTAQPNLN